MPFSVYGFMAVFSPQPRAIIDGCFYIGLDAILLFMFLSGTLSASGLVYIAVISSIIEGAQTDSDHPHLLMYSQPGRSLVRLLHARLQGLPSGLPETKGSRVGTEGQVWSSLTDLFLGLECVWAG